MAFGPGHPELSKSIWIWLVNYLHLHLHHRTRSRTKTTPSGGGALCVPAEAGGVYGVVRPSPLPQPARLLSQPACIAPGLHSGLRWLERSGDDPVGCLC